MEFVIKKHGTSTLYPVGTYEVIHAVERAHDNALLLWLIELLKEVGYNPADKYYVNDRWIDIDVAFSVRDKNWGEYIKSKFKE